ncbi:hypothetical protein [Bartonella apis]|uniref:hypothetical protein n=1 Tax=Bartonella apis TaxID=1686310 RepID=UPI0018DD7372|nr:hypothetical protein [Bartonella apis]
MNMSQTKLTLENISIAAHASGNMRAHSTYSSLAKPIFIGRQYFSTSGKLSKLLIGSTIRVACRIFYNVKQNAYRCLPPGGNASRRCPR